MAEAFNKLLSCDEPENLLWIPTSTPITTKPENTNPCTALEVEIALKKMRNYNTCVEDQVFAEMWKYAGNTPQTSLHIILEKI